MTMTAMGAATGSAGGFTNGLQTPEVKARLSDVVRARRAALVKAIGDEADSAWRLSLSVERAGLAEGPRLERKRLEQALQTQVDAALAAGGKRETAEKARKRLLTAMVTRAAATFFNRVVALRQLEALRLSRPVVVTGGFASGGWREFREYAPALLDDENGAYALLLRLLFDERAVDLPGLFGDAGETEWFRVPAHAVRETVEALDDPVLREAWTDGTLLGWVYQFWNDPDRDALDEKIDGGGKIEPHEIAAKTQIFTERYLVEWLLQNSIGAAWLAICAKNGWTPDVVAHGTLEGLEARRADWRGKRARGEVGLEDLMPVEPGEEDRWKYWVVRELPPDAGTFARDSVRDVKLLDPACGSGHFLVIAFDLLAALYEEEARHRGESWTREQIAAWIIEDNLHGIDIDPRAVQIAAAALMITAKVYAPAVVPARVNLVASNLGLASLPDTDPALRALFEAVELEARIPQALTRTIVDALKGADHLGSLLKVDHAVDGAIARADKKYKGEDADGQLVFTHAGKQARGSILASLDEFLKAHTSADDLGLRTGAAQLAAGVRFIRLVQEGQYDLVVGNPPYFGTGGLAEAGYVAKHYKEGKADLYAAFLMRGLQLAREGGTSALLTMRNWMFLGQYEGLRRVLVDQHDLRLIGDVDRGAFEGILDEIVSTTITAVRKVAPADAVSVAMQPTPREDRSRDGRRTSRKRAALLAGEGRYAFRPSSLQVIEGRPLIYWWDEAFVQQYASAPKIGNVSPARFGATTGADVRFLVRPWEIDIRNLMVTRDELSLNPSAFSFVPWIKGGDGSVWIEPLQYAVRWSRCCLELITFGEKSAGLALRNPDHYFRLGVVFSMIGASFTGRLHRFASIFTNAGSSLFPEEPSRFVCLLNSSMARELMSALNPSVNFTVGDVNRLPLFPIESADDIVATLDIAFTEHEAAREPSVEFRRPGPSPWRAAQEWAQTAVDRPAGDPLPPYTPEHDAEPATDHLSFALGVALGRFDAFERGVLDPRTLMPLPAAASSSPWPGSPHAASAPAAASSAFPSSPHAASAHPAASSPPSPQPPHAASAHAAVPPSPHAASAHSAASSVCDAFLPPHEQARLAAILPHGTLFLSACNEDDGLSHPAARVLHEAWEKHGPRIAPNSDLRTYLREKFFADVHRKMYENRPVHFPLSSSKRTFVAWVNIHRFDDTTLLTLLADHLEPEMTRLEGDIVSVLEASKGGRLAGRDENRLAQLQKWRDELRAFIDLVYQCAERGAPPADPRDPKRETDARFHLDLDDGVMINSAALWPLLEPQWKDPRKWWRELSCAEGKKDYDWAHLAARYWPARVAAKCATDPSLAVAHGCFWRLHPEKAYQWEQRLKLEIGPHFTLDEPDAATHRAAFESAHPDRCAAITDAEQRRHARRAARASDPSAASATDSPASGTDDPDTSYADRPAHTPRGHGSYGQGTLFT